MLSSGTSPSSNRLGLILIVATLLVYGLLSFFRHSEKLIWDEDRYLEYAHNLTQGFYVTDADPNFVNGPAYPLVLVPFVHSPRLWLWARLLNAVFMAGAVGFVWFTLRQYVSVWWALVGALLTGLHPTMLWVSFALMSEPFSMFLITGFVWSFTQALRERRIGSSVVAALFLAGLILTRVFFGHVLVATACLSIGLLLIKDWRPQLKRALLILAGAFVLCVPYLGYTYAKTGEVLCWSTNSGELLYWMTSHKAGENGHWYGDEDVRRLPEVFAAHGEFYEKVLKLPILEREAMFKEAALANFKDDPMAVAYNWACNLVRLAFGFPRSHRTEELRQIVLIAVNGPLIIMAMLAGVIGARFWKTMPVEIWLVMGFAAFYLGGGSLAPALPRYFVLMVPLLWLGVAQVFSRHLRVTVAD